MVAFQSGTTSPLSSLKHAKRTKLECIEEIFLKKNQGKEALDLPFEASYGKESKPKKGAKTEKQDITVLFPFLFVEEEEKTTKPKSSPPRSLSTPERRDFPRCHREGNPLPGKLRAYE
ncbi:UNVERIFIED_CONTAM: hypothetical protein K2H54_013690 [Gekko kuhli]